MNLGRKPLNITQRTALPRRKEHFELLRTAQLANLSVSKANVSAYFTCASEMLLQTQTNVHEAFYKNCGCKSRKCGRMTDTLSLVKYVN